ncbi:hypothetical protein AN218_13825 [Streptomyces nanshensis]|uniref:Putative mannosyltransferase YkcA/B-like C-terminal domain-containing protein n=1 Tax=Streptomyces nanshensis TaxID=518642 RepID=A0A1E7L4X5_9ACTN|nr:hypothetical protein AN218_13825 [Streptomyces nanshensis]
MGGLLNGSRVSKALKAELTDHADDFTWAAATVGAMNGASYQLAAERPVMSIGGFNGTDPAPTVAQFKKYVKDGRIHYFIGGDSRGGPGGGRDGAGSDIQKWVKKHYTKETIGGTTLYDLTKAK